MNTFIILFAVAWLLVGLMHLAVIYRSILALQKQEDSRFWATAGTAWVFFTAVVLWPKMWLPISKG